jgi:hypothetical protein
MLKISAWGSGVVTLFSHHIIYSVKEATPAPFPSTKYQDRKMKKCILT